LDDLIEESGREAPPWLSLDGPARWQKGMLHGDTWSRDNLCFPEAEVHAGVEGRQHRVHDEIGSNGDIRSYQLPYNCSPIAVASTNGPSSIAGSQGSEFGIRRNQDSRRLPNPVSSVCGHTQANDVDYLTMDLLHTESATLSVASPPSAPVCTTTMASDGSTQRTPRSTDHACFGCSKEFVTATAMEQHAKTFGCRSFKCRKCDFQCSRNDTYCRHIRVHNPSKKYPCKCCDAFADDKGFDRADTFDRHMRRHHPQEFHADLVRHCPLEWCRFAQRAVAFHNRKDYDSHMTQYHGQGKLDCPVDACKRVGVKGFSQEGALVAHVKKEHAREAEGFLMELETYGALTGSREFPRQFYRGTALAPALEAGDAGSNVSQSNAF